MIIQVFIGLLASAAFVAVLAYFVRGVDHGQLFESDKTERLQLQLRDTLTAVRELTAAVAASSPSIRRQSKEDRQALHDRSEREAALGINISRGIVPSSEALEKINAPLRASVEEANQSRNYALGHSIIAHALLDEPRNPYLYFLSSDIYTRQGKPDEARLQADLARELGLAKDPIMYYVCSRIEDLQKNKVGAIDFCLQAVASEPRNPRYVTLEGFYEWKYNNNLDRAISLQKSALNLITEDRSFKLKALNNLCYYYASLGGEETPDDAAVKEALLILDQIRRLPSWEKQTSVLDTIGFALYRKFLVGKATKEELWPAYESVRKAFESERDNPLIIKHLYTLGELVGRDDFSALGLNAGRSS